MSPKTKAQIIRARRTRPKTVKPYDVCLVLEGTYPYVTGGVSSWVHNLIKSLPDIRFCGLGVFPTPVDTVSPRYDIPDNFHMAQSVYVHTHNVEEKGNQKARTRRKIVDTIADFHHAVKDPDSSHFGAVVDLFQKAEQSGLTISDLIYRKEAWDFMVDQYKNKKDTASFIDYFWTYRFTHFPLFNLLRAPIPKARVYHTISTGYAGLIASVARHVHRRPMLLTEHGIYTKERKLEIAQAEWIFVAKEDRVRVQRDVSTFQQLWIKLFEKIGHITYQEADRIFTLYEGNRKLEISEGADPHKIEIIPNGIEIERFEQLKPTAFDDTERNKKEFTIAFVGRVVPIKDVKTFVRACKIASMQMPGLSFLIMGPTSEDPEYFLECKYLAQILGLATTLTFTGRVNVMEYYKRIDLLVLTSVSEAQPLVILEGNAAGIPAVASDVGASRELIEGRTRNDRMIGPAGIVTPVDDPTSTADAIVKILSNPDLREKMSVAGRERVKRYYGANDLYRKYLTIYQQYMSQEDL